MNQIQKELIESYPYLSIYPYAFSAVEKSGGLCVYYGNFIFLKLTEDITHWIDKAITYTSSTENSSVSCLVPIDSITDCNAYPFNQCKLEFIHVDTYKLLGEAIPAHKYCMVSVGSHLQHSINHIGEPRKEPVIEDDPLNTYVGSDSISLMLNSSTKKINKRIASLNLNYDVVKVVEHSGRHGDTPRFIISVEDFNTHFAQRIDNKLRKDNEEMQKHNRISSVLEKVFSMRYVTDV